VLGTATRNTKTHTSDESPAKTPDGRADNWLELKSILLYRGEKEIVHQLSGILSTAKKLITNINIHIHARMHVCMYDCLRSESESASH
jgi:hypothetical protein